MREGGRAANRFELSDLSSSSHALSSRGTAVSVSPRCKALNDVTHWLLRVKTAQPQAVVVNVEKTVGSVDEAGVSNITSELRVYEAAEA